jgi:hypothetical protein
MTAQTVGESMVDQVSKVTLSALRRNSLLHCTYKCSVRITERVFSGKEALILHVIANSRLLILFEMNRRLADRSGGHINPRSSTVRSLWRRAVVQPAKLQRSAFLRLRITCLWSLALMSSGKAHVEPIYRPKNA